MTRNLRGLVWGFALLVCMSFSAAMAQTVNSSITGQVTDPSGAAIAGAQVVAHNVATGVDSPTTTNQDGSYRIDFLPIGHYQVIVTAQGFEKEVLPAFSLEIHQTPTFNVKLRVGSATETVAVNAAAPILDTSDATISSTFSTNTISNFPLNGQDFSAITLYMPGSIDTAGTSGPTSIERSTYYTDTPNMNGNRAQANNYTLDGIDMNETFNNLISYSPAPQALEQIQVMTANAPANYGNVNGGDVVSVLKSGTNGFHGSAYGYVQDYRFNADSWQNDYATPRIPVSPFSEAQFGGTLGGPIKRDKLFFFVDYLGARYHTGGTGTASVLTAQERTGNFSDVLATYGIQFYDPAEQLRAVRRQYRSCQQSGGEVPVCQSEAVSGTQCLWHEWSAEQLSGPDRGATRRTTRATSRSNTTCAPATRSQGSIRWERPTMARPRYCPSSFRAWITIPPSCSA